MRAGGHAIVWSSPTRATLVFRIPRDRDRDLGVWALLDLGRWRWRRAEEGYFRGLATARVPVDCLELARARAERDSIFPGPTRRERFDCLACGACCKQNEVPLNRIDLARIRRSRPDLLKRPYVRRRADGKWTLTLLKSGVCRQLEPSNRCAIYEIRPRPCSSFVIGSECCMSAREEEGVTE